MRKLSLLLWTMLSCTALFAQRVIDTREAHPGKDLTMEEAIFKGVGYCRAQAAWLDNDTFVMMKGRGEAPVKGSVKTTVTETYKMEPRKRGDGWITSPAGYAIKLDGSSLIGRKDGREIPIGISDDDNIVYGGTAMRNEFGFSKGWEWSPSGKSVAFYRKDQTDVTVFPLLDIKSRTGSLVELKYPMNGMASEKLRIGIYNFEMENTVWLDVTDFGEDRYITNLAWSPDDAFIFAQVVDRAQHHMHLNKYSATNGKFVRTILTEENDAWIEPLDPVWFIKGRNDVFLYRTANRDGWRHLYLVDTVGTVRHLPTANGDLEYLGNDGTNVFYTSGEQNPVGNHLFKLKLRVPAKKAVAKASFYKPVMLTSGRGWHNVNLNEDFTWFLDNCSNTSTPSVVTLRSTDGKKSRELFALDDPLKDYASCKVELGTVPSADGAFENYYRLIYPKDFDPAKKYPVIVYVYGGPHSQMVQDAWLGEIRMWEMLMAQRGYVVYVQDNRGTQNRGLAFEQAINRQCGKAEMEDQIVGIKHLMENTWVDSSRIGVHGWSYGGFMTISLMTSYPDIFKVGVAGGPVIDWKWYEIMYGERYMDNPETNPEGFENTSLINKAKNLKGKLLICQGAVDDTVVWEHSLSFIQECIDNNIQVNYFPYPVAQHNVFGRNRIHLMDKVTMYFEDYL